MSSQYKILFLDDHTGLREAITNVLIQKNSDLKIFEAADKDDAESILKENQNISTLILDLNIGGKNGLELLSSLREINKSLNTLVYTMYNDPMHIEQAVAAGVQGYITKDAGIDELEKAILVVASGGFYYNRQAKDVISVMLNKGSRNEKSEIQQIFSLYQLLTQKEKDVFYYLAQKKDPDEIAIILGKSEKTVINQKSIIYSKMNIRDRLELLEKAKALGLII